MSFPFASCFERIYETILSSMDVDEFADAYSANITKTLNTTHSDSIDTTRVLVTQASNSVIIILLILSTVKCVIILKFLN